MNKKRLIGTLSALCLAATAMFAQTTADEIRMKQYVDGLMAKMTLQEKLGQLKQKTAYEMCGRDWSSDVCSSDLGRWTV